MTIIQRAKEARLSHQTYILGGFVGGAAMSALMAATGNRLGSALLFIPGCIAGIGVAVSFWEQRHKTKARVFCENGKCGKFIPLDAPWVCGFCGSRNDPQKEGKYSKYSLMYSFAENSFLDKCRKCEQVPQCFICPQCREKVFLGSEKDERHAAMSLTTLLVPELPPVIPAMKEKDKRMERDEKLEDVDFDTLFATKLTAKAKALWEQQIAEEKLKSKSQEQPKSHAELLKEDLARKRQQLLGVAQVATEARKEMQEKYKGNPDLVAREEMVISRWEQDQFEKEE